MTKNFKLKEFFKDEKTMKEADENVLKNLRRVANSLQKARDLFGKEIIITSGYRTREHNKKIGGVEYSQHLTGQAADFTAKRKEDNEELFNMLRQLKVKNEENIDQLIVYKKNGEIQYFHLSVKETNNRKNILYVIKK